MYIEIEPTPPDLLAELHMLRAAEHLAALKSKRKPDPVAVAKARAELTEAQHALWAILEEMEQCHSK